MGFGEINFEGNQERLKVFFNALLGVEANRVGWAILSEFEGMAGVFQVVFGFGTTILHFFLDKDRKMSLNGGKENGCDTQKGGR